jgi:hypothetical protein
MAIVRVTHYLKKLKQYFNKIKPLNSRVVQQKMRDILGRRNYEAAER